MTPFFNLQRYSESNDANLLFDYSILNAHLCVNAETKITHTEMDSSYKLITYPDQPDCNWRQKETQFNFHIGSDERIIIRMTPGICFMFSGYLLSHNQEIPVKTKMANQHCILTVMCGSFFFTVRFLPFFVLGSKYDKILTFF